MKQVYELRYGFEIVGVFQTENKAIQAIEAVIEYLKVNNGISVIELPSKLNKYSMINVSDGKKLYVL